MEIKASAQDIEDLAKLEVAFDYGKVTKGTWALFMSTFRKLFWNQNICVDLSVMAANDALVDVQASK